jgi:hypothetical protein
MISIMLPSIFTIEIGDTPTLVFEAQNFREALDPGEFSPTRS